MNIRGKNGRFLSKSEIAALKSQKERPDANAAPTPSTTEIHRGRPKLPRDEYGRIVRFDAAGQPIALPPPNPRGRPKSPRDEYGRVIRFDEAGQPITLPPPVAKQRGRPPLPRDEQGNIIRPQEVAG